MISNGLGTIANIILDPVLILGFGMGVAGAAAATVIGNGISFLYLLWYVTKKQKAFSLNIRDLSLKKEVVLPIVTLGLPLACYGLYQLCATFLQSTGKASYATVVALLDKGIIYLPVLFGLNALFGLNGVIYTAPLTDMLSLLAGAVLCLKWNKNLKKD